MTRFSDVSSPDSVQILLNLVTKSLYPVTLNEALRKTLEDKEKNHFEVEHFLNLKLEDLKEVLEAKEGQISQQEESFR